MFRCFVALALVATLSAGPVSIGLVTASGPLTVDRSSIWGNATLFEGTSVSTADASGEVALRNGVRIQLAPSSQAVIGEKHARLERGATQINVGKANASKAYEVEAHGLRIAADAGARVVVAFDASNRVQVSSLSGKASVSDHAGVLLAAIQPGRTVAFAMPQNQPASTSVMRNGCLLYKDMHFILHDDATNEVVELNGSDLNLNVGKSVQVTGNPTSVKPAVSIATSVMNVTAVAPRSTGGCLVIAQTLDAQTQVPAAAGARRRPLPERLRQRPPHRQRAPAPDYPAAPRPRSSSWRVAAVGGGVGATSL